MLKLSRLLPLAVLALAVASPAQTTTASRIFSRMDLAASGTGVLTTRVAGTNYLNQALSVKPSTTVGTALQLRYTKSPLIGFELNYSYARYSEDFSCCVLGGIQTNAHEVTGGYVVHGPKLLSATPFASIGAGSTEFKPTANGGQGFIKQFRATYFYSVGVDAPLIRDVFGVRAQFRQLLYLAPDFGQNYLTIKQRAVTSQPAIGFYVKF